MLFSENAGQTQRTQTISFVDFDHAQRGDIMHSKWSAKEYKNYRPQKKN